METTVTYTLNQIKAGDTYTSDQLNNWAKQLYHWLEQYGDSIEAITACIQYALNPEKGGSVNEIFEEEKLIGICITNNTGMKGYIPENILVYIATDPLYRGKGVGKKLMQFVIDNVEGEIALHVEAGNPARFLYERLGF